MTRNYFISAVFAAIASASDLNLANVVPDNCCQFFNLSDFTGPA